MANYSKIEKRRQQIIEALERARSPVTLPLCHCGEPARYEINRLSRGVQFYCAKHLPPDALS